MATTKLPIFANVTVATSDTAATNGTIVQRDSSGGVFGTLVQGSTLATTGTFIGNPSVSQTVSFTAGAQTEYFVDATGGAVTVTLPNASANKGMVYHFWATSGGTNHVIFTTVLGVQYINSQYAHCRIVSDGTNWYAA